MMDTSPQYMRMANCPDIQWRWFYTRGDWWAFCEDGEWMACCDAADNFSGFEHEALAQGYRWLPRLDQLVHMAPWSESPASQVHEIHDFMESCYPPDSDDEDWEIGEMFDTWEQIWLAYVMLSVYRMVWVEGQWQPYTPKPKKVWVETKRNSGAAQ